MRQVLLVVEVADFISDKEVCEAISDSGIEVKYLLANFADIALAENQNNKQHKESKTTNEQ